MTWWNPLTWFRAKELPKCRMCGKASPALSAICWECSEGGTNITKLERGDTVRDKEAEKALWRAKMKELNRDKAG